MMRQKVLFWTGHVNEVCLYVVLYTQEAKDLNEGIPS